MNQSVLDLLKERYFLSNESEWKDVADRLTTHTPYLKEEVRNFDFLPSTPTIMNLNTGGERIGTLSSCFPMDIEDSIKGIYDSLKEAALVTKHGGGVGYDFTELRSSLEKVDSLKRHSSGPIPFISNFNEMLDGIRQGGVRRGAGMALLSIYHPDILEFIRHKRDRNTCNRFNFSVKIDDKDFYEKLEKTPNTIHQVKLKNGEFVDLEYGGKKITINELWNEIMYYAWDNAEPGIYNQFIAIDRCSVLNISKKVISNPCNEFTNIPYSSCNLGSINLTNFVKDGKFDWERFRIVIKKCVRYLNYIIDVNLYTLDKIEKVTKQIRPIGLGTMGLANLFYQLGYGYGDENSIKLTREIHLFLTYISMSESIEMAKEKNCGYDAYEYEYYMQGNNRFFDNDVFVYGDGKEIDLNEIKESLKKYSIYNSCNTVIAPTGGISFISEVSNGIEPNFRLCYIKRIEELNKKYRNVYVADRFFEEYLNKHYPNEKENILKELVDNNGSCQNSKYLTDDEKKTFVVSSDLSVYNHLDILEQVANSISLSVSKTINMQKTATINDVSECYINAYKRGIIGVTIYRDGSRDGVLVDTNYKKIPDRPKELNADIHRITVKGEKWYVFVGLYDEKPYEVFAGKCGVIDFPKSDKCVIIKEKSGVYSIKIDDVIVIKNFNEIIKNDVYEGVTRLISYALRNNIYNNIPLTSIIDQLNKAKGDLFDFEKSIARSLKKYITNNSKSSLECPKCGNKLTYIEGCLKCLNCGESKCN